MFNEPENENSGTDIRMHEFGTEKTTMRDQRADKFLRLKKN